jgi:hypothetical protein
MMMLRQRAVRVLMTGTPSYGAPSIALLTFVENRTFAAVGDESEVPAH